MSSGMWLTNQLRASDRGALEAHFLALGAEDRRLRFGVVLGDDSLKEYVARLDFERDEVFSVRDEDLAILGVVHVAFMEGAAELGLSVLESARGKGVGNALFERAVMHLRNRGVQHVHVHCLSENQAMMHLASKHGMHLARDQGESRADLVLRPATATSHISEWIQNQNADTVQILREGTIRARRNLEMLTLKRS